MLKSYVANYPKNRVQQNNIEKLNKGKDTRAENLTTFVQFE